MTLNSNPLLYFQTMLHKMSVVLIPNKQQPQVINIFDVFFLLERWRCFLGFVCLIGCPLVKYEHRQCIPTGIIYITWISMYFTTFVFYTHITECLSALLLFWSISLSIPVKIPLRIKVLLLRLNRMSVVLWHTVQQSFFELIHHRQFDLFPHHIN